MSENSYLITLLQKENQTIIAYEVDNKGNYTGVEHTKSFFAKANSKWKFTVIPDKYHEDYWIHIIQSDHQTITVKDNASYHDYRAGVLVSYPDDDKLTKVQAGILENSIYPETQYDTVTEEPHDRYKYLVVNQNCRIFATLARDLYNEEDYHTVTIIQSKHQTIVFTYGTKKYYGDTVIQNNEDYSVEVIPDTGYTSTSLIINGKTINSLKYNNGKATSNLVISAVPAFITSTYIEFIFKEFNSKIDKLNNSDGKLMVGRLNNGGISEDTSQQCTVTITQPLNATLHVYTPSKQNGVDHTSTFTVPVNTPYEAELIGDEGVLPGEICVTSYKSDNTIDDKLDFIYLYKKSKIKNTPMKFGNIDNDLYVSTVYDTNNLLYQGNTNNLKLTSNNFIQPQILKYYGFDYLFGYFDELEGSSASNKTISIKNSNNKLTLRLLGYNLFNLSKKSTKKTGRWVVGFNNDNKISIKSISLYIYDDNNSEICKINKFEYLNTISGDTNNSNKVKLYYSNSLNDELDSAFLYLLDNKNKKIKIRLLIE